MSEEQISSDLFINLLRILTVEEINDLTTTSSGHKKALLTDILNLDLAGKSYAELNNNEDDTQNSEENGEAKILPFTQGEKNKDLSSDEASYTKIEFTCGPRCQELLEKWSLKFEEMDKNVLGVKRFAKNRSAVGQKEISTFILEEKEKFKDSYEKLKKTEVMDLYKKSAAVDIKLQKANRDDLSKSTQSGVLVNRKQA